MLSQNKIDAACSTNVELINTHDILLGKSQRKGQLARSRYGWEHAINTNHREI
jgi:hypothetical protein